MYTPNLADEYDLRGLRSELFDEGYMFSERWGQPLVVYADGSCLGNGRYQQASAGIGLFWGDCEQHFQRLPGSEQTNNRAELYVSQFRPPF
jgi:hypothetical protein